MSTEQPTLLPSQFDPLKIGELGRCVNMFRGDLILPFDLAVLPGKPGDHLLETHLGLTYQSNVSQQVQQWNLDTPTSVAGVGWTLSGEQIVMANAGALTGQSLMYSYVSDNVSNALIPLAPGTQLPVRATLSPAECLTLAAGTVSSTVQQAFLAQGLLLDVSTQVSGTGPWTLQDAANERDFSVAVDGVVTDCGQSFQLHRYEFWMIVYYPNYVRWEITTDLGEVRSYGGGVTTDGGISASAGNSVAWGVSWTLEGGDAPAWLGPSSQSAGQVQYAKAWNLAMRKDRWGNQVSYGYNGFGRGSDGLLLCDVEQRVGTNGLPYTKSVYLTQVIGATGITANLVYGNKSYTTSVMEYMDPHKALAAAPALETPPENLGAPNSYQDCYETLYLSSVNIVNAAQNPMASYSLSYTSPMAAPGVDASLAVTAAKRYLSAITETNQFGQTAPSYAFSYCMDGDGGPNPAALQSVTYPQGAVATWTYSSIQATSCDRSVTISAPTGDGNWTPLVWFGPDYALSVWIDATGYLLQCSIYLWSGRWIATSLGQFTLAAPVEMQGGAPAIVAAMGANCAGLIVTLENGAGFDTLLFGRSSSAPTDWSSDGPTSLSNTISGVNSFVAGENFLVAAMVGDPGGVWQWTWNWSTNQFSAPVCTTSAGNCFVTANTDSYLAAVVNTGSTSVSLNWLDVSTGEWAGEPSTVTIEYDLSNSSDMNQLPWAMGPSTACLAFANEQQQYVVALLNWDAEYNLLTPAVISGLSPDPFAINSGEPLPPAPELGSDGMVSVGSFVFRFDNGSWSWKQFPVQASANGGWVQVSCGPDVAVEAVNLGEGSSATVIAYDPDETSFVALQTVGASPAVNGLEQGWCSAISGEYLVAQNALYFRGSDPTWSTVQGQGTALLTSAEDTTSLIDGSPSFLAVLTPAASSSDDSVTLFPLQSGGPLTVAPLGQTAFAYNSPAGSGVGYAPGQGLSGPSTLVSYTAGGSFLSAQSFQLTQYADLGMTGAVCATPVASLTVTHGFEEATGQPSFQMAYEFRSDTATCDPTGLYVGFQQSAVYNGCGSMAESAMGRRVYLFENGYSYPSQAELLNGQMVQTVDFQGSSLFQTPYEASCGIAPSDPVNGGAVPVPAGVAALFAPYVTLSDAALISYLQPDVNLQETQSFTCCYWQIVDGESLYNLDYAGDPQGANAGWLRGFAGNAVQVETTAWQVLGQRNVSPSTPDVSPMSLHGGCAKPMARNKTLDGVGQLQIFSYTPPTFVAAPSSLHYSLTSSVWDGAGLEETHVDLQTGPAAWFAAAAGVNLLIGECQRMHLVTVAGTTYTTHSTAMVWQGFAQAETGLQVMAAGEHWRWSGDPTAGGDQGVFPFAGTPNPLFWLQVSTIVSMRADGLAEDSLDGAGTVYSTMWDQNGTTELARADNASFAQGQVAFASFDPLEDLSAWAMSGGAGTVAGGQASERALSLPAGGAASFTLEAPDTTRPIVLTCAVKSPVGFIAGSSSAATLTLLSGGKVLGDPVVCELPATEGEWQMLSQVLNLPELTQGATGVSLALSLGLDGSASGAVAVDNVTLVPMTTRFVATTRDSTWRTRIAEINSAGSAQIVAQDTFQRALVATDHLGSVVTLSVPYASTTGNAAGFSAADPNALVRVAVQRSGSVELFLDDSWGTAWTVSAGPAPAASGGTLAFATEATTLTATSTPQSGDMAVFVETVSPGAGELVLASPFTLSYGTDSFHLSEDGGTLTCTLNAESASPSPTTLPGPLQNVMMLQIQGYVLVWVNGQLQFSYVAQPGSSVSLLSGGNALGLRNLCLLDGASVGIDYMDACGNGWQTHRLTQQEYSVGQTIYDGAGRAIVQSKRAPGSFGSGGAVAVPCYRPGLINVGALLPMLNQAATMEGDLSDWYSSANAPASSDDGGYPYMRTVLEPSQLNREIERGLPGAAYAIVNLSSTPAASRPTVKVAYGSSVSVPLPDALGLPASFAGNPCYHVTVQTDPAGNAGSTVVDGSLAVVARYSVCDGVTLSTLVNTGYGSGQVNSSILTPNYWALSDDAFVRSEQYNAVGQKVQSFDPDRGTTMQMYDGGGRLRLIQTATLAGSSQAIYLTWDELSRPLARGVVTFDWSTEAGAVQAALADALWPETQSVYPFQRIRLWSWDGDGSDLLTLGQLAEVTAYTSSGSGQASIVESYTYDANGSIVAQQTVTTPVSGTPTTVSRNFAFDNQARLTAESYPFPEGMVGYSYDGEGRMIGSAWNGSTVASYGYDPNGYCVTESRDGSSVSITRSFDPLGREVGTTVAGGSSAFHSTLSWSEIGLVAGLSEQLSSSLTNDQANVSYSYDPQMRLTQAVDANSLRSGSTSYDTGTDLDLNGNIQSVTNASASGGTFEYTAGTNQIASVTVGLNETEYDYLAGGAVNSTTLGSDRVTFSYQPGLDQVQTVDIAGASSETISYLVDAGGRRTVRQSPAGTVVTLLDSAGDVIGMFAPDGSAASAWIKGPTGIAAMISASGVSPVTCDFLSSPRLVFDGSGELAAYYAYDAWGNRVVVNEPTTGFLPFGFNARRWDSTLALYDFGARFYDPALGRFLAPDPLGQYPSPYLFCVNQPTLRTDPSGMVSDLACGLGIVLTVASFVIPGMIAAAAAEWASLSIVATNMLSGAISGVLSNLGSAVRGGQSVNAGLVASGAIGGAISGGAAGKATADFASDARAASQQAARYGRREISTELTDLERAGRAPAGALNAGAGGCKSSFLHSSLYATAGGLGKAMVEIPFNNEAEGRAWNDGLTSGLLEAGGLSAATGVLSSLYTYNGVFRGWSNQTGAQVQTGLARYASNLSQNVRIGIGNAIFSAGANISSMLIHS